MGEREPKEESGYAVSEDQSRFFQTIGLNIPDNLVISFREAHIRIMQGKIDGLNYTQMWAESGLSGKGFKRLKDEIEDIGEGFAIGSNTFNTAISCAVGIGVLSIPEQYSKLNVQLNKTEGDILGLLIQGYRNGEIWKTLKVPIHTIVRDQKHIYEKFGVKRPHQGKSSVVVAIAVDALKRRFDSIEASE